MKPLFNSIIIELTDYCNFKCQFCPSENITRGKGFMSLELMDKILNEISKERLAENVQFGLMGEPFLHKKLFEMIDLGKKYNINIRIFTNGSLFTDENINKILQSGVNGLYISYRAVEEAGFGLNSNYNFSKYEGQVKKLLKKAIELNNIDKIFLKVFKNSLYSDIVKTRDIGDRFKSDNISYFMTNFFDFIPEQVLFSKDKITVNHDVNVISNIFVRFETVSKWNNIELSQNKNFKKGFIGACDGLSGHFGVLWNGDVTTCCKDYNGDNVLGNVAINSLVDILNADRTQKIKRALKWCYLPTEYCRVCRGGNSYTESAIHQIGSIIAYKTPMLKKLLLGLEID